MIQTYAPSSPGMIFCSGGTGPYVLTTDHLAALEAQKESWRDNKRDLENDLALKMEKITALTAANEESYEEVKLLMLENKVYRHQVDTLNAERDEAIRIAQVDRKIKEAEKKILIEEVEKNAVLTTELEPLKLLNQQREDYLCGKGKKETSIINPEPLGDEFQAALNKVPYEEGKEDNHD